CGQVTSACWSEIRELARHPKVVGLGETGLDNYRKFAPPVQQERWLRRHMELAEESGLPLIVHNRLADARLTAILQDWSPDNRGTRPPGVMHCFSADAAMLESCLTLGFTISFAGPVTFKNADSLRAVAKQVPASRLVVETDSPYLTPLPHRGERNEP